MKPLANLTMFALLLLALLNNNCVEQNAVDPAPVHINFTVLSFENVEIDELPAGASLTINLETSNGFITLAQQQFVRSGNGFSTTALNVTSGTCRITDAILLNDNDEIIYATPKINTVLASVTTAALPVVMEGSSQSNSVALSLLDVRNRRPDDFGYTSFKNPNHVLKLTVNVKGSPRAVSATAYLMNDMDTLQVYSIKAAQNHISIPVSEGQGFRLLIAKEGYANYSIDLSPGETNPDFYRKPLKVVLEPAFTMLAYVDQIDSPNFRFDLGVMAGAVFSINWGDGGAPEASSGGELYHYYPLSAQYPVEITGDLDKITSFYSYYGQGMIDLIDFRHLTSIIDVTFGLTRSPAVIDLSHNSKLYFLNMAGLVNTRSIILPENHVIQYIGVEGPNLMTTESVDALIENLYLNCIRNNIRNGILGWAASWYQDEGDFSIIGPPSETALEQVRILKESYGWSMYPDPFDQTLSAEYKEKLHQYRNARPSSNRMKDYKTPYQLDLQAREKFVKHLN